MSDRWEKAKSWWNLDETPGVTDASSANNYMVEDEIAQFQEAAKTVTDKLAEVSADNESKRDTIDKYRAAVSLAYVALMDGNYDDAEKALAEVVNK